MIYQIVRIKYGSVEEMNNDLTAAQVDFEMLWEDNLHAENIDSSVAHMSATEDEVIFLLAIDETLLTKKAK